MVFPVLALVFFVFAHLKASVATEMGNFEVSGLSSPVQISHDLYGTPKIVAKTDRDAYFAIGFKHASDRLWQLEMQRRLAQGRLSEVLGSETVQTDIWMRTLGLHEAAKQSTPYLKQETIEALTAYADGINAWIAQSAALPIEFQILGIRPEPWSIYDSLSWQKVFSLTLNGNMYDEMRRSLLQGRFNAAQIKYFYPYDPVSAIAEKNIPKEIDLLASSNSLLQFGIGHLFAGSNAWVVSGRYTKSGHPIIANDPHLGLQLPALWYVASIKGDKLDVSGMTLVGLPMVIFGQNSDIAWGGTSLESDQEDLFIETTSPKHPNKYLNGDEWKEFSSHTETIKISPPFPSFLHESLNPIDIVIRKTDRGPVISDVNSMGEEIISLRWAALDSEDHTIDSFLELQYAKNWIGFRQALSQLKSPGLNFLYADRVGNIGYQAAGMVPKRKEGVGILPLVASKNNNWDGYFDFNLLPSGFNPEKGFWVSANEKVDHSAEIVISHEWAPSARHDRISSLLEEFIDAGKLMTVHDMEVIQGDRKDLTALSLLPILKNVLPESSQEKDAILELNKWNGEFDSESVGATLFATWSYYLTHTIFDEALNYTWQRPERGSLLFSSIDRLNWSQLAEVISTNSHGWCKDNQANPCSIELRNSLKVTLRQIEKISGTKTVSKWKWGDLSRTEFIHQPFGSIKGFDSLFKKTVHSVASPNSINASNIIFDGFTGFTQNFGAGFRQIFELDTNNSHWYMLSTGQSGNVMSPHFGDMVVPFASNQLTTDVGNEPLNKIINLIPTSGQK